MDAQRLPRRPGVDYTDTTGMTTLPSPTDLPLVQSTYGNHNRTVCGYGS